MSLVNNIVMCKDCQHQTVCKWTTNIEKAQMDAGNIVEPNDESPIRVTVDCLSFNKKTQKQDSFHINLNNKR